MGNQRVYPHLFNSSLIFLILISMTATAVLADLAIHVSSDPSSDTVVHEEVSVIKFGISHENKYTCSISCYYSLIDTSTDMTLQSGTIEIDVNDKFSQTLSIKAPSKEEGGIGGQKQYIFYANCHDVLSGLCLSDDEDTDELLFTQNYELSPTDRVAKEYIEEQLDQLKKSLEVFERRLHEVESRLNEVPSNVLISDIQSEYNEHLDIFEDLKEDQEGILTLHTNLDYHLAKSSFQTAWISQSNAVKAQVENLDQEITNRVARHNEIRNNILAVNEGLNELSGRAKATQLIDSLNKITNTLEKLSESFEKGSISSYDSAESEVNSIKEQIQSLENQIIKKELTIIDDLDSAIKDELLKACPNPAICSFSLSLDKNQLDNYLMEYCNNSLPSLEQYFGGYNAKVQARFQDELSKIKDENTRIKNINVRIRELNKLRERIYEQVNDNNLKIDTESCPATLDLHQDSAIDKYIKDCEDIQDDVELKVSEKEKSLLYKIGRFFTNMFSGENHNYKPSSLFPLQNEPLKPKEISFGRDFIETVEKFCTIDLTKTPLSKITISEVDDPETLSLDRTSIQEATQHKDQCCLFNKCRPCCEGNECRRDTNSYPIIFLHGHSFLSWDSPEYSLDAFNILSRELAEDGILPAGIILPSMSKTDMSKGEWGRSGNAVSVKATYYYDSYNEQGELVNKPSKSESISTYADRLHDAIDLIKYLTNRDGVIIIAHSMGGLVSREYIRKYGSDSVYKLIMIGTPNHGIDISAYTICKLATLTSVKECEEMYEKSEFIADLSKGDASPGSTNYYTITGHDCNDGDGVVKSSSVPIKGGTDFEIEGACSGTLGIDMHSDLLDPTKYPETLSIIRQILRE